MELQDRGIKYRQAWASVNAVFEASKLGLRRDGNVELPFGRLVLKRNRPAFNMLRQGKLVPMNERSGRSNSLTPNEPTWVRQQSEIRWPRAAGTYCALRLMP